MNKPTKEGLFDEVIICDTSLSFWRDRYKKVCLYFDNVAKNGTDKDEKEKFMKELALCSFRLNYENKIITGMQEKYKKFL